MAKSGLMGGQGAQGGGFFPSANGGGIFSRGPGGILPERGSQAQMDIVGALMQSAMSGAQNSGSPLLALLAPMIGGAVTSRTQGLYDQGQKDRAATSTQKLLELMGNDPRVAGVLEIMNDQGAPDHVKSLAASLIARRGGGGKGGAGGGLGFDPRQANIATNLLGKAIKDLTEQGYSPEEARDMVRNDPLYAPQWAAIDRASAERQPGAAPSAVPVTPLATPNANTAPPPPPKGTVEF